MSIKRVSRTARVERHRRSAGLSIAQLHQAHLPVHLDPFLAFDHFEMAEPFFPPHPHAGFSAVTYMFPQSRNGFLNRDSQGSRIEIRPGDLHWTAAGSGLVHEEVPLERGVACQGLQIFVDLPAAKKWMAPEVIHASERDIPRVQTDGVDVRVVAGAHAGVRASIAPPTAVTLLDIELAPGATFEHRPAAGETRFAYVIAGEALAGPENETRLATGEVAGFAEPGDVVRLRAGARGAQVVVAGGRPLHQPVVFHGPFCMSTREDIGRAITAYQGGAMGHLEPSF